MPGAASRRMKVHLDDSGGYQWQKMFVKIANLS
jgi:hypothetical protein